MLRQTIEELQRLSVDSRCWHGQSIPKLRDGRPASGDMRVYYGEYGPKNALVATRVNPIRLLSVSAGLADAKALHKYGGLLPMPYTDSLVVLADSAELYFFLTDLCLDHAQVTALPVPGGYESDNKSEVVARGLEPFLKSLVLLSESTRRIVDAVEEDEVGTIADDIWCRLGRIHDDITVRRAAMRVLYCDMIPRINDCFEQRW